ncbi:MAG: hypothetical protein Q8P54_03145, partial [bacterium]|nr:hypothetical protein [bacterium]
MLIFIVIFLIIVAGIGGFFGWNYISRLRRDKDIERSLKIVPLLIKLPPASPDETAGRDQRELIDENITKAEGVFNLLSGIATHSNILYGRKFISMEIVAKGEQIYFYLGVPVSLLS